MSFDPTTSFDPAMMTPTSTTVLWEGTSSTLTSAATGGRLVTASYRLTEDGIHFASGILSTREEVVPLWSVRDVDLAQSMTQKVRGVGDLTVNLDQHATVYGQQTVKLASIVDPQSVRTMILAQANQVRAMWNERRRQTTLETQRAGAMQWAPPGAQPPSPEPSAGTDMMAQLTKLGEMRTAGLLTNEEFAAAKAKLLG